MARLTTGLRGLDRLIGGLHYGDNVVWESSGIALDPFVERFIDGSAGSPTVYVSFHVSPKAILDRFGGALDPERSLVLDCFTDGLGRGQDAFTAYYRSRRRSRVRVERLERPRDPEAVTDALVTLGRELGKGARYVFDSLTGMQELWSSEDALSLFRLACPRLYDQRTVAYWLLERDAHEPSFLSRLAHVTQVVLELRTSEDGNEIHVGKAQGRSPDVAGRKAHFTFDGGQLKLREGSPSSRHRAGQQLRAQRIDRGITQAELARKIGITPSALSQAERGLINLSPDTSARALSEMGLSPTARSAAVGSYSMSRRGGRDVRSRAAGLTSEEVARTPRGHRVFLLRVEPGASGRKPPFATKREELVVMLEGLLELRIGEARELLHAGDAIVLTSEPITSWRNPGPSVAQILWEILA